MGAKDPNRGSQTRAANTFPLRAIPQLRTCGHCVYSYTYIPALHVHVIFSENLAFLVHFNKVHFPHNMPSFQFECCLGGRGTDFELVFTHWNWCVFSASYRYTFCIWTLRMLIPGRDISSERSNLRIWKWTIAIKRSLSWFSYSFQMLAKYFSLGGWIGKVMARDEMPQAFLYWFAWSR